MNLLTIQNLTIRIDDIGIIDDLSLTIRAGEIHALMGPNGSGKSTLAQVLAGRPGYEVEGSVTYLGDDLFELTADERARRGLFLGFQYPPELPGVTEAFFLKAAVNARRSHLGESELDAFDLMSLCDERAKALGIDPSLIRRAVNEGFSGGEKKKNEILQMAILEPRLAMLDEPDSGLDIDSLKEIAKGIERLRSKERAFLLITHYRRLLDLVRPDQIHVLVDGRIQASGGVELADVLEAQGYAPFEKQRSTRCAS